jgi:hypothetical protein
MRLRTISLDRQAQCQAILDMNNKEQAVMLTFGLTDKPKSYMFPN